MTPLLDHIWLINQKETSIKLMWYLETDCKVKRRITQFSLKLGCTPTFPRRHVVQPACPPTPLHSRDNLYHYILVFQYLARDGLMWRHGVYCFVVIRIRRSL